MYSYSSLHLLVIYACICHAIANIPSIDVHCEECQPDRPSCCNRKPLDIHEPTTLNFLVDNTWNDINYFEIRSTSNVSIIPSGIFQHFRDITIVRLSTGLKTISRNDFLDAQKLIILELQSNKLQKIPNNVFSAATNLKEIDLSKNQINDIEDNAFAGLNKLNRIYLHNNSLTILRRLTFAGADNLDFINLQSNQIETIEDDAFLNTPKLTLLSLSYNRIQTLSDNAFSGGRNLQLIHLASNGLQHIGRAFYHLEKLVGLDLSQNHIDDIDLAEFEKLAGLQELKIKDSGYQGAITNTFATLRIIN